MIKNILLSLSVVTLIVSMSACSVHDIVDDLTPDGSATYSTKDLGAGNFSMEFKFNEGVNHYTYTINDSQDSVYFHNLDGNYQTSANDTLTCIKRNEESFSCTSSTTGIPYIFEPNPKLYLHKTTIEFEDIVDENDNLDIAKYEYKLETITVDGLERY